MEARRDVSSDVAVPSFSDRLKLKLRKLNHKQRRATTRLRIQLHRRMNRTRMSRARQRVFIDCGANIGRVLADFIDQFPDWKFYAIEPQPELEDKLRKIGSDKQVESLEVIPKAVWIEDGTTRFYLANQWKRDFRDGSTIVDGHKPPKSQVDFDHPLEVETFDFSSWLQERFSEEDYVVLKMDIEGAEYQVLEKMICDGTLGLIAELHVEFHQTMNDSISPQRHRDLVDRLRKQLFLNQWH